MLMIKGDNLIVVITFIYQL